MDIGANLDIVFIAVAVIVLIVCVFVLVRAYRSANKETFSGQYYYNEVSMRSNDPTMTFYTMRDRDVLGMDHQDYFLETQRLSDNGVLDIPLDGTVNFANYTDYLEMPAQYRPDARSAGHLRLSPKYNNLEANILEGMTGSCGM